MTAHEIVIRFGRSFDVDADKRSDLLDPSSSRVRGSRFLADIQEIRIPFGDSASAHAAAAEIEITVRPVHDAGGEDYRPVVAGEVIRPVPEIESREPS